MNKLVRVFLLALVTARLTRLAVREEGPSGIARHARGLIIDYARKSNNTWLVRGVKCQYCVSFWIALLVGGRDGLAVAGLVMLGYDIQNLIDRYVTALEEAASR